MIEVKISNLSDISNEEPVVLNDCKDRSFIVIKVKAEVARVSVDELKRAIRALE